MDEWEVLFEEASAVVTRCVSDQVGGRWVEAGAGLGKGREQAERQVGGAGTGRATVDDQEVVFEVFEVSALVTR